MMSQNSSAKPKWINVKKQLPPEWEDVLMRYAEHCAVGYCTIDAFDGSQVWYAYADNEFVGTCDKPLYWMPLPEPPRKRQRRMKKDGK